MEDHICRIVAVLEASGARWALVGAHAIGFLTTPRATLDVDFVVEDRRLGSLVLALEAELGPLELEDLGPALRLKTFNVDLIRSGNHPLFGAILDHVTRVDEWNVPRPEALISLKFLAAISPWRARDKKLHDLGDLVAVYRASEDALDRALLRSLAALAYPGAEQELESILARVDAGEPLTI